MQDEEGEGVAFPDQVPFHQSLLLFVFGEIVDKNSGSVKPFYKDLQ